MAVSSFRVLISGILTLGVCVSSASLLPLNRLHVNSQGFAKSRRLGAEHYATKNDSKTCGTRVHEPNNARQMSGNNG